MASTSYPMFGVIEYLVIFQMIQRKIYDLYQNEKSYDHVVSGTGTDLKCMRCGRNICHRNCIAWWWVSCTYVYLLYSWTNYEMLWAYCFMIISWCLFSYNLLSFMLTRSFPFYYSTVKVDRRSSHIGQICWLNLILDSFCIRPWKWLILIVII